MKNNTLYFIFQRFIKYQKPEYNWYLYINKNKSQNQTITRTYRNYDLTIFGE